MHTLGTTNGEYHSPTRNRWRASLLAVVVTLCALLSTARGSTLIVTNLADSGPGTLRQSVAIAAPGDEIRFSVRGDIYLLTPLIIDKSINIFGRCISRALAIDGLEQRQLIVVTNNAVVTITDLIIRNALNSTLPGTGQPSGGGVINYGKLTLERVIVDNCVSEFGLGGGIFSPGDLTLRQCTVAENIALQGGGIAMGVGRLILDASTVWSNRAVNAVGALGGGILVDGGTALVTNSTVTLNFVSHGDGGGIAALSYVRFESCTIVSNTAVGLAVPNASAATSGRGGGIFTTVVFESRNTILAGNHSEIPTTNGIASVGPDGFGTMLSQGWNLIQNPSGLAISGVLTGNLLGVNPLLAPLTETAIDAPTSTHALLPGSPAIDAGSPFTFPRTDQNGLARPQDGNGDGIAITDIGSYEKPGVIPGSLPGDITVTTLADSGPGSLRDAITRASNNKIAFGVTGTIFLTSGPINVDRPVWIAGPGVNLVTIDGQGSNAPIIIVRQNVAATVSDLTLTRGVQTITGTTNGGGIQNFGALTLIRVAISQCSANSGFGGGIYSQGALTLQQCSIAENTALGGGGIADFSGSPFVVNASTINANQAIADSGGGILRQTGITLVTNSTVSGNLAVQGNGGGIATATYLLTESCTIVSNRAFSSGSTLIGKGGGVYTTATLESRNTIFAGNSASTLGPDVFGVILSQGWNLIQNPAGAIISGVLTGNLLGVSPLLGPLSNNGGPTLTHALLFGSPAIDAGSPFTFPPTDQTGMARPQDGNGDRIAITDIGSFEKADARCEADQPFETMLVTP